MKYKHPPFRVGLGFDVHSFQQGRPLMLGGVQIAAPFGLAGHSDADVLLHAVADAIFGAIGSPDIGQHFPNTDQRWKNCPSSVFVREAENEACTKGYTIVNIDCTILAEKPKIAPHLEVIRQSLSALLEIPLEAISLKATTMEKMGFIGREEGMAAMVVVLLGRPENL